MMARPIGQMFKRGEVWWVGFVADGRRIRESTRSTRKGDAQSLLKQRIAEIHDGRYMADGDRQALLEFT